MANSRRVRGGPPFQAISLRPTWLTTGRGTGKVTLGKTRALGDVSIEDTAAVAVEMLGREDVSGWFDLLSGDVPVKDAVEGVVRDKVDCIEGEVVQAIMHWRTRQKNSYSYLGILYVHLDYQYFTYL